jgi:uncharacterized membrane protein YphA (DoxX/SURF4 family)
MQPSVRSTSQTTSREKQHVTATVTAMTVLTIIFSLMLIGGAIADWMKVPKIVESVRHVKVPEVLIPFLPICKTLGAAGLLLGLKYKALGVAAGIGLVAYFAIAVWFHLRVKDRPADTAPAVAFGLLALVVLLLRLAN